MFPKKKVKKESPQLKYLREQREKEWTSLKKASNELAKVWRKNEGKEK